MRPDPPTWSALGFLLCLNLVPFCNSGAVQLDQNNIDGILANNDLVLINFYADWCRFSNMLAPIWDEGADRVASELQGVKVVMGKVDCDREGALGTRFHITKYPTIKYVQHGVMAKKEYRGQRSAEAFLDFVRQNVRDPISEFTELSQVAGHLEEKKRHVIGYFGSKEEGDFSVFKKVSSALKDDCEFHAGFGEAVHNPAWATQNRVTFRGSGATTGPETDLVYEGPLSDYDQLFAWATEHCCPLVREITFENAEELTEEGLPFLILFHKPEDEESVKEYNDLVTKQLIGEKGNVNFLVADGLKFAHPLSHLGKSKDDLPLIAVDSFRHMYLFPKYEDIRIPGKVNQFLQDLYSGKLHREFHYGPDKTESTESTEYAASSEDSNMYATSDEAAAAADDDGNGAGGDAKDKKDQTEHIPRDTTEDDDKSTKSERKSTDGPPESQFARLGPSKNRYTILRDEF